MEKLCCCLVITGLEQATEGATTLEVAEAAVEVVVHMLNAPVHSPWCPLAITISRTLFELDAC